MTTADSGELEIIFSRTLKCLGASEKRRVLNEFMREYSCSSGNDQVAGLFPFFLRNKKWPAYIGFLPDLAALEWALRLATNAPEVEIGGFDRVITASEPQWFAAQFRFDPAHAVMISDWPMDEVFTDPSGAHSRRPGKYLIYRMGNDARVRSLDENEARLLEALTLGVPLGVILDRPGGPEFDAFLFHDWIQTGLLKAIHWAS